MKSKLFHVQLTVFCDKCGSWEYIHGTSKVDRAVKIAISKGWKLNREESRWTCPRCLGDPFYTFKGNEYGEKAMRANGQIC